MIIKKKKGFSCGPKPKPQADEDSMAPDDTKPVELCLFYDEDVTDPKDISNFLIAENSMRKSIHRLRVIEQTPDSREEEEQLKKDKDMNQAKQEMRHREFRLRDAFSKLPEDLQQDYNNLRDQGRWYLRESLIQDCSDKGGCCSRGCGCCESRMNLRRAGRGHCTTACFCCKSVRESEFPVDKNIKKGKKLKERLENPDMVDLVKLGNGFFSPLEPCDIRILRDYFDVDI